MLFFDHSKPYSMIRRIKKSSRTLLETKGALRFCSESTEMNPYYSKVRDWIMIWFFLLWRDQFHSQVSRLYFLIIVVVLGRAVEDLQLTVPFEQQPLKITSLINSCAALSLTASIQLHKEYKNTKQYYLTVCSLG